MASSGRRNGGSGRRLTRRPNGQTSGVSSRPKKSRARKAPARSSPAPTGSGPQAKQRRLLDVIHASVEGARSLEEIAQECLKALLDRTGAPGAAVYLLEQPSRKIRQVASLGPLKASFEEAWEKCLTRMRKTGRSTAGDDLIAVPMMQKDELEGALVVQGVPKEKRTAGKVLEMLESAAAGLAVAFNHCQLAHKYAEKIIRIQQLEEVSEVLNSSLNQEEVLERAIQGAMNLVEAEACSLLLVDEFRGDLYFRVAVGHKGDRLREVRLALGRGIVGMVAKTGESVLVNDAVNDPRVAREVDQMAGFKTRNILAVPVRIRDKTLGVMEAVNKRGGRPFSKWDLLEFSSLSHQVAIALENLNLMRNFQGQIARLEKLQEISAVLNSSLDQKEIRKRAIDASMQLMDADAASLLLLDEKTGELYFEVALGEKGEEIREIRLKPGQGIAGHVAQTGEAVIVNDVQHDSRFARQVDNKSGFVTRNMICVPVKARDKTLGVLQAINKHDNGDFLQTDLNEFISLGHQVGIAIENANLYEEISRLFEGFISASVQAIESRDPVTSGHSERVAILTCGLAEVVDRVDGGPYAEINFDPDQMREIRYAALLHDFGKVGVREHVLVKANKLFPGELALLKARFEFIKRTLQVQALQRKVELLLSGDRESAVKVLDEIDKDMARQVAETEGLLEYLLVCNLPTVEPAGGFNRLKDIAQMQYESFDGPKPYLASEEVVALSVAQGNLTVEERLEIESHVTHTYKFLSTIPWTKKLKNIPEIAYGHHEKLDGTGYPLKVPGQVIPVQTRMMTISDIYDALTAADRPYKAAVPPPQALRIIESEVKHGKVDSHLFELFVEAKVYTKTKPRA